MTAFRSVLITGASSGLGAALARRLLDAGAQVGVCGRDPGRVMDACAGRANAHPLVFDVTDVEATRAAVCAFDREAGPIDLAALNAGTHQATDAAAFDPIACARLMAVNYGGLLSCLAPVLERMTARRAGTIAITGSLAAFAALPNAGAYCASKAAVKRLAESLRVELEAAGVDVRLIAPGFVRTPLTDRNDFPMPLLMDADEAADRILRGLAGRRFEIAFPARLAWALRIYAALPEALRLRLARRLLPDRRSALPRALG